MIPWEHDCKTCLYNTEPKARACEECANATELTPTIKVAPVVRCKDCKHNDIDDWCPFFVAGFIREPNDYCVWGERREDG